MERKLLGIFVLLLDVTLILITLLIVKKPPSFVFSPLGQKIIKVEKKQILGFYPYWNLDKLKDTDISDVDTVFYFAVDLNGNGSFNKSDPGWYRMNTPEFKDLRQRSKRLGLTIVNLDQNSITQNVNRESSRKNIITNTVQLMKDEGFIDLNIDLEYVGPPDENTKKNYTQFVADLCFTVRKEIPESKISMDIFTDSITKPRIFDLKTLANYIDYFVIMAYDFNRPNAVAAGPVAPLPEITLAIKDYLDLFPSEKLVLGVPFYGYEWPVLDNSKGSWAIRSYRGPELSTYHRSIETARNNYTTINFDEISKSPWFSYYDKASYSWRQVWFEDERSIGFKLDLVNQRDLSGIAIFALGYDGPEAQPLWQTIQGKLPVAQ